MANKIVHLSEFKIQFICASVGLTILTNLPLHFLFKPTNLTSTGKSPQVFEINSIGFVMRCDFFTQNETNFNSIS